MVDAITKAADRLGVSILPVFVKQGTFDRSDDNDAKVGQSFSDYICALHPRGKPCSTRADNEPVKNITLLRPIFNYHLEEVKCSKNPTLHLVAINPLATGSSFVKLSNWMVLIRNGLYRGFTVVGKGLSHTFCINGSL